MSERKIYDLINPSDPCTLVATDDMVAVMAALFIGEGQYGVKDEKGEYVVGMFLGGGAEKWFKEKTGKTFSEFVEERWQEIADCLDSTAVVKVKDRADYDAQLEKIEDEAERRKFKEEWDYKHRSSLNKLALYAYQCADAIRANHTDEEPPKEEVSAPRSVYSG